MLRYFLLLTIDVVSSQCFTLHDAFTQDHVMADRMCEQDEIEFQQAARSAIACVQLCTRSPVCNSVIFYRGNKTCFGVKSVNPALSPSPLDGAVFYKPASPTTTTLPSIVTTPPSTNSACTYPMVAGLADSQLSASSEVTYYYGYTAKFGRLDNPSTCWSPNDIDINQYLQVDFSNQRVLTAVITQGDPSYDYWVDSYKVFISSDCITFQALISETGDEQIFPGNTDRSTKVTNVIEPNVTAQCLRVNPMTWAGYIAIRFEVEGCDLNSV